MGGDESCKTASELLFERYLRDRGLDDFDYEPEVEGTSKRPDYLVTLGESEVFFEVKEFKPPVNVPTTGWFDLYSSIRSKIAEAQKQLRPLKGRMCAVVFANPHNAFVFLKPMSIYGAMLGNLGLTMPANPATGSLDVSRAVQAFLSGGKMHRHKNGRAIAPQNTTMSAICVLEALGEGSRRFGIRIAQWEHETGEMCSPERIWNLAREAEGTEADGSISHLRIVVYENLYAVAPLTEAFGTGPYDERFGVREGHLRRVFVGPSLEALEADERAVGVKPPDLFGLGLRRE